MDNNKTQIITVRFNDDTFRHDSYDILIGRDLTDEIVTLLKNNGKTGKVLILTDDNTNSLFLNKYSLPLKKNGFEIYNMTVPPGERSKSIDTYEDLLEHCSNIRLTRSDTIIALGGGVIGDLAGFTAGTYLRGVDFYQIPTTLLAAVDSSVGGKTGINLKSGKNLAGVFLQPRGVLCDLDNLKTLNRKTMSDGIAEIIKYGMICDPHLFNMTDRNTLEQEMIKTVKRCIEIKAEIVGKDEKDKGIRQLLNFGHTMGHAIEKSSNFTISHGYGVSIGMTIVTKGAVNAGICKTDTLNDLINKLVSFNLPVESPFDVKTMLKAALYDKKIAGDKINVVVPESTGKCIISQMNIPEFKSFIEGALQ